MTFSGLDESEQLPHGERKGRIEGDNEADRELPRLHLDKTRQHHEKVQEKSLSNDDAGDERPVVGGIFYDLKAGTLHPAATARAIVKGLLKHCVSLAANGFIHRNDALLLVVSGDLRDPAGEAACALSARVFFLLRLVETDGERQLVGAVVE